nr:hypothetical protein Iba_chr14cCG4640 [Ipomoea batatas]
MLLKAKSLAGVETVGSPKFTTSALIHDSSPKFTYRSSQPTTVHDSEAAVDRRPVTACSPLTSLQQPTFDSAASFRISRRRPTKAHSDTATSSSGSEPSTLLDVRHSSKDYRAN